MSVFSGRIDEIFAAVGEQLFLAVLCPVVGRCGHLPRVDVHAVLSLLGKGDGQRDNVAGHLLTHVLGQLLLLQPVLVQRGHEVRERAGHLELDLQALTREDKRILHTKNN